MTDVVGNFGNKIAAGYAAIVAEFVAESHALKTNDSPHAATLGAAYAAFAAGYTAASVAAEQVKATVPFPLLPLSESSTAYSPFDVLTLAEAAEYLRLPESVVRAEAETGRLVGRSLSGEWRFTRGSAVAWLQTPLPKLVPTGPSLEETQEECEAFLAVLRAQRDEVNRATKSGPYAEE